MPVQIRATMDLNSRCNKTAPQVEEMKIFEDGMYDQTKVRLLCLLTFPGHCLAKLGGSTHFAWVNGG